VKLPRITGQELVRALKRYGFVVARTRGSHFHLHHPEKDIVVTVPVHAGKILAPKTLKAILKAAGLTPEDLKTIL